jgi:hypothetical protein
MFPGSKLGGDTVHELAADIGAKLSVDFTDAGWAGDVNFCERVADDV